jgi:hypothetical protein
MVAGKPAGLTTTRLAESCADMASPIPSRQVRALYDETTITVYQAYSTSIADAAVKAQKLSASPDFKPGRMTWIKPSWAWMMYRSGYSFKDAGQARILALKMSHQHFLELLRRGVLTSHHANGQERTQGPQSRTTDVKIQWDPERSAKLDILPYRSIQIGIPASLSTTWTEEWIVSIEDVTHKATQLKHAIDTHTELADTDLLDLGLIPVERPFPLPQAVQKTLGMCETSLH